MKIALLSNVNLDILIQQTAKRHDVFSADGYGQWIRYALSVDEPLLAFAPECIYILLDGYGIIENLKNDAAIVSELTSYVGFVEKFVQNYPMSKVAISSLHICDRRIFDGDFSRPLSIYEKLWDDLCEQMMERQKSVHRFRLREIITNTGIKTAYDDKMWYMGSIPYSISFLKVLSNEIDVYTAKLTGKRKKVLISDLDNTLWGGVVGEDGALGIMLGDSLTGAIYRDTQKLLKQMKDKGVLLAIVSKNNLGDVMEVFHKNTQMVLHEEDFSAMCINWETKPQNIRSLAEKLNLGMDSFVFLDDNNVEREAVKQVLPEVTVLDFPRDTSKLPSIVRSAYDKYFWEWRVTDEDKERTIQYHQEAARRNAWQKAEFGDISMADYLKSLNIEITLCEVNESNIERTVQLLNKTNQFNTNTVRMDMEQMRTYLADELHNCYVANVKDKYGDSGLIAVVLVLQEPNTRTATIGNFLMSCRVMGRQIENAIIRAVENKLLEANYTKTNASYIKTVKNSPVKDIWTKLGYSVISTDGVGNIFYSKDISQPQKHEILSARWIGKKNEI